MTTEEITSMITYYRDKFAEKYPSSDGIYWNKGIGMADLSFRNWGITDTSGGSSNWWNNTTVIQCCGFALFMARVLYNKDITYIQTQVSVDTDLGNDFMIYVNNLTSKTLQPGDIIRVLPESGTQKHSGVVWKKEGNIVKVLDCLGASTKLNWGDWSGNQPSTEAELLSRAVYIIRPPVTTCSSGHSIPTLYSNDENGHWKQCQTAGCGYLSTESEHSTFIDRSDNSSHWEECSTCGYRKNISSHTISTTYSTTAKIHWKTCSGCNREFEKAQHSFPSAYSSDAHSHWHQCATCGYKKDLASHTWVTLGSGYRCSVCGRTSAVIPADPST